MNLTANFVKFDVSQDFHLFPASCNSCCFVTAPCFELHATWAATRNERDKAATERDKAATERDLAATERDKAATERDKAATCRDELCRDKVVSDELSTKKKKKKRSYNVSRRRQLRHKSDTSRSCLVVVPRLWRPFVVCFGTRPRNKHMMSRSAC